MILYDLFMARINVGKSKALASLVAEEARSVLI
jgi:GTP-binding protein EngB required for normal cell division